MTTTPCVKCGEALSPGVRFCPNCGTRQPDPSEAAPTQMIPPVPPPPAQGESAVPPTILVGPPQQNSGASPQTPPQGYGAQPNPYGYGTPPPAPPAKKSRFPLIAIILGAVALCLVVGVVGVIGTLTLLGRQVSGVFTTIEAGLPTVESTLAAGVVAEATPRPTRVRATATPEAESTAEVEATPTVEELPTEDTAIVEDVAATEEAALQATDEAFQTEQATVIAQQEADAQAIQATTQALGTGASVIFRDEFVDNRNAWFLGRFNDNETNIIENGVFRVIRDTNGRSFELYQPRALTNFIAEVDCKVVDDKEGGCGLVYGQNDDQGRWDFDIYTDYYQLNIIEGENATRILEGDPTGLVRPNDWNKVRIIRRDGITYFYINDVFLGQTDDNRFANGRVGVLTTSYQESGQVEIQFDNFIVSDIK